MSCSKNLKTNILKCTKKFINEMMKVLLTSLITTKYDKNEREKIITYSLIIFFGCL
jgi:superfamily II DNA or RNA helicase